MQNHKGFSLIELMVVVAIIGIIAALAIPALLRARIAANEAGAKSDLKVTSTSTVAYANGNNGAYPSNLTCMGEPTSCSGGPWPAGTIPFLDKLTGCAVTAPPPGVLSSVAYTKSGYTRTFVPGTLSTVGTFDTGLITWVMIADPGAPGVTGVNYFGTDQSGLICFDPAATIPYTAAGLTQPCRPIGG